MSGRVGVGVVGAGAISTQYLRTLTRCRDLEVRFIADLDLDRAKQQAAAFDIPASGSLDDLLRDDEISIVVNLTIPRSHAEVSLRAIRAGRHVWSEKPLAVSRDEARAVLDAARVAGVRVGCAPDTLLGAGLQGARRALDDGEIGRPISATVALQHAGPDRRHHNPAFLFAAGGGPVLDMGPYYLTTLVNLLGPVSTVSARATRARTERVVQTGPLAGTTFPVEAATHVGALLEFESGAFATATFSFDSALTRRQLEITGTAATMIVPDPNRFDGEVIIHGRDDSTSTYFTAGYGSPALGRGLGVAELADAIRAGRPERASGELAFHVLDLMLAIDEAARSESKITLTTTTAVPPPLPESWNPLLTD